MKALIYLVLLGLIGFFAYRYFAEPVKVSGVLPASPKATAPTFPREFLGRYRSHILINVSSIRSNPAFTPQQKDKIVDVLRRGEIIQIRPTNIVDSVGQKSELVPGSIVSVNGKTVLLENSSEKLKKIIHCRLDFDPTGVWLQFDEPPPGFRLRYLRIR
ncbi:hypothetical protein BH09VER1_BH09VER1_04950 [soil metagenome]